MKRAQIPVRLSPRRRRSGIGSASGARVGRLCVDRLAPNARRVQMLVAERWLEIPIVEIPTVEVRAVEIRVADRQQHTAELQRSRCATP